MPIKLYHFTSREGVRQIIAGGFDGDTCWLTPDPATVAGNAASSGLLEVTLNCSEADLQPYVRAIEEDEIWDEERGDSVKDPSDV